MKYITFNEFCVLLNIDFDKIILPKKISHHSVFSVIAGFPKIIINSIFEIGTCAGSSCEHLAMKFPVAKIKTLDLFTNTDEKYATAKLSRFNNVTMEHYDSRLLEEKENGMFDFVFVDGCHFHPVVDSDILWGYNHSNKVVVFHDAVNNKTSDVLNCLSKLDISIPEDIHIISDAVTGVVIKGGIV